MCTAQVLMLHRDVMRRNFGGDVNRRVCRKLFENDSSSISPSVTLKKMQEEIRKKDTERWNFDFMTETPLPGRYQWEPVFTTAVPASKKSQSTMESNRDDRIKMEPIVIDEILSSTTSTSSNAPKRKRKNAGVSSQCKITDFMTKKKRISSDESSSSKLKISSHRSNINMTTRLR